MRGLRIVGLVAVVVITGLVGGGAAGADQEPTDTVASGTASAGVSLPVAVDADRVPADPEPPVADAIPAPAPVVAPVVVPEPVVTPEPTTAPPTPTPTPEPTPEPTKAPEPEKAAEPEASSDTPCKASARACVDLSSNQAWLLDGGEVQYGPVPITSGRKGYRTPTGTFEVSFKNIDHVSSIYDAPMPYSVFFNGGIAFHQGSLSEKSHGCIHLSRKAAKNFYGSLSRGDVVQVVS